MRKQILAALTAVLVSTAPAWAEQRNTSEKASDMASDHAAIAKDEAAIAGQDENLTVNRIEKQRAKANDDPVAQAGASVKIGANHVAKGFKRAEKHVDKKILEHDANPHNE